MDFNLVIKKTLSEFKKADIHYALIGGFALGMWGISRATVDVDFLVLNSDMDKVDGIMKGLVTKESKASQNGKNFSRGGAEFAEKSSKNSGLKPRLKEFNLTLRPLRLCERRLFVPACPG